MKKSARQIGSAVALWIPFGFLLFLVRRQFGYPVIVNGVMSGLFFGSLMAFCDFNRPPPPKGIEYRPLIGWLRWGWVGARFVEPPAHPEQLGIEVFTQHDWGGRQYHVVLAAADGRSLEGCVVGYWIEGQSWRFRANRPIPSTRNIALKLRFDQQRFAVYTRNGESIPLRVVMYYHDAERPDDGFAMEM